LSIYSSGVAIIFLTISVLLIICLAFFLIGLVLRRGGCDPLKDPEHDQVFSYIDQFIDLNKHIFRDHHRKALHGDKKKMDSLRISQVIAACHRNESIFDVLRLGNEVNIDNIREFPKQFEINRKLDELADNVRVSNHIKILNDDARRQLREFSTSQLNSFALYKYDDNLIYNITKYDLKEIANR
jgi:prominin 1